MNAIPDLVVHRLTHPEELDVVRERRMVVHDLVKLVRAVLATENLPSAAAGHGYRCFPRGWGAPERRLRKA